MFNLYSIAHHCATVTLVVSMLVMFGWYAEIEILKTIIPGAVTMKFNTAFAFLFSGLILLFALRREKYNSDWALIILPSASMVILIFMGTTLMSVMFGFVSGIESLFVRESANAVLTTMPGRPSIGTMLAFILVASAGIVSIDVGRYKYIPYWIVGVLIIALAALALLGYLLQVPEMYYAITGISTAMAIHTAALFLLLGVGFILVGFIVRKSKDRRF